MSSLEETDKKFKEVIMSGVIHQVEIDYKEVIITAEEARKMIKEYEERIEALRMKTLEDFYSKIKIF